MTGTDMTRYHLITFELGKGIYCSYTPNQTKNNSVNRTIPVKNRNILNLFVNLCATFLDSVV